MNIAELFTLIESPEFDAEVNLASTSTVFWSILSHSQPVQAALDLMREDARAANQIIGRVIELSEAQIDPRYANPHDTALAAYIWALAQIEPAHAQIGASIAMGTQQTWWVSEVINAVFNGIPELVSNTFVGVENTDVSLATVENPFEIMGIVGATLTTVASLVHDLTGIRQIITDGLKVLVNFNSLAVDTNIDLTSFAHQAAPQVNLSLSNLPVPAIIPAQWSA